MAALKRAIESAPRLLEQPRVARQRRVPRRPLRRGDCRVQAVHRAAARQRLGAPAARHGVSRRGRCRRRARQLRARARDRPERQRLLERRHASLRRTPLQGGDRGLPARRGARPARPVAASQPRRRAAARGSGSGRARCLPAGNRARERCPPRQPEGCHRDERSRDQPGAHRQARRRRRRLARGAGASTRLRQRVLRARRDPDAAGQEGGSRRRDRACGRGWLQRQSRRLRIRISPRSRINRASATSSNGSDDCGQETSCRSALHVQRALGVAVVVGAMLGGAGVVRAQPAPPCRPERPNPVVARSDRCLPTSFRTWVLQQPEARQRRRLPVRGAEHHRLSAGLW